MSDKVQEIEPGYDWPDSSQSISTKDIVGKDSDPESEMTDIIIYTPHHGSVNEFKSIFSDLYRQVISAGPENEETLARLFEMERDVFTHEAAMEVANRVVKKRSDLRVRVVRVIIPRAIMDVNRVKDLSIGRFFNHGNHQELVKTLMWYRDYICREIIKLINKHDKEKGVFLEIHSMSGRDPSTDIVTSPTNVRERIAAWNDSAGKKRKICVINENDQRKPYGNQDLANRLKSEFNGNVAFSDPYRAREETMSCLWEQITGGRYGAIDFPKHLGARQNLGRANLWEYELDENKIRTNISIPIANAILGFLSPENSPSEA